MIDKLLADALQKAFDYFRANDYPNAEELYRQILRVDPGNLISFQMVILTCAKNGNLADARKFAEEGIYKHPDNATLWNNLGLALSGDEAIECYQKAISLNPETFHYTNLALEHNKCGNRKAAEQVFQQSLQSNNVHAWFNYAAFVQETGDLTKALELYQQTLTIDPDFAAAHYNRSICWFLLGEWLKAWPEYEWRWQHFPHFAATRNRIDKPYWQGQKGRVHLYGEQGFGDFLMFARYIPLVQEIADVSVEVPLELRDLLRLEEEEGGEMDYHCSLLSLPGIFGTTPDNVPSPTKFYKAATSDDFWAAFPDKRIGIAWAGSPIHPNDKNRSTHLKRFAGLEGKLFSLHDHYWKRADNLNEGAEGMKVVDLSRHLTDWSKTAAVVDKMDLVVTVDTAVAHLAGSLGKPTWMLLPWMPDWRWGIHGQTTPWYAKMQLVRQAAMGDWDSVFTQIQKLSPDQCS